MNPLVSADAALLAALGLSTDDVAKALAAKGDNAKSKSARLVWNQGEAVAARGRLAEALARIPQLAETIERAAVTLGKCEQDVKGLAPSGDGAKRAAEMVRNAGSQLAAGLDAATRESFESNATIAMIADALRQDARILKGYASNAPGLGRALAGNFAQ
jgi:predicted transcriptional regulator